VLTKPEVVGAGGIDGAAGAVTVNPEVRGVDQPRLEHRNVELRRMAAPRNWSSGLLIKDARFAQQAAQTWFWLDGPIQCRNEGIPLLRIQREMALIRKALFCF
jgi:hypothetical protein